MYQKLKNIISGQKIKKLKVGKIELNIAYNKKVSFVDPLLPLKEIRNDLNLLPSIELKGSGECEPIWETKVKTIQNLNPTHFAKFSNSNINYVIKRFVTKEEKKPVSIYAYWANDHLFAIFTRRYDYGKFYVEVVNNLTANHELERDEKGVYLIKCDSNKVLLRHFGHSHSFIWNDEIQMGKLISILT